ncbi:hypothetical protein WJX77_012067 [Trebouxia sp. C0004]
MARPEIELPSRKQLAGTLLKDAVVTIHNNFSQGMSKAKQATDRDLHVVLRPMLETLHRGAPSGLMTPDHKTRTVTLIVRGGCELKEAAKASSFSEAGYKRGRDQAIFRGKASSQGLNPKMTLVAQRKASSIASKAVSL